MRRMISKTLLKQSLGLYFVELSLAFAATSSANATVLTFDDLSSLYDEGAAINLALSETRHYLCEKIYRYGSGVQAQQYNVELTANSGRPLWTASRLVNPMFLSFSSYDLESEDGELVGRSRHLQAEEKFTVHQIGGTLVLKHTANALAGGHVQAFSKCYRRGP